jgi:hypothetical protein
MLLVCMDKSSGGARTGGHGDESTGAMVSIVDEHVGRLFAICV